MSEQPDIAQPRNVDAAVAAKLAALLGGASPNSTRVISPLNESARNNGGAGASFYCVHSLSGTANSNFTLLAERLSNVPFLGIEAPRKRMKDPGFPGSVEMLGEYYANALTEFQAEGVFLVGGWSAGAIIALEVAQRLRARGREVGLLVAIDAAPNNSGGVISPWNPLYLLKLASNLPGWIVHENLGKRGSVGRLLSRVSNKAIALGKLVKAGKRGGELIRGHEIEGFVNLSSYPPAQRSFMKRLYDALLGYVPQKYSGNVVVYEAKTTPFHHLPQVGSAWRAVAPQSEIVCIDGTHSSIIQEPSVNILAEDLRNRLAQFFQSWPSTTHPEGSPYADCSR